MDGISHIQSVSEDDKCAKKKKIRERDGEGWGMPCNLLPCGWVNSDGGWTRG